MSRRLALLLVVGLALAFLGWNVGRHAFLCDDAFISFRYVRNLVDGHGLVFNRGERVEGYTNFLWVLELAALWAWAGVRPETAAPVLSALATAACVPLVALIAAGRRGRPSRDVVAVLAVVLWATNRSVAVWGTSGLETRQFTLFVILGWWAATRGARHHGWLALASLALGLAELTRPEALLIGPLLLGAALAERWWTGRLDGRALLAAAAPFAAVVGGHLLWRYGYYGEWLPNTYYAKAVRPWWDMGGLYLGVAALEHGLYLVLPLGIVGTVSRVRAGDRGLLYGWAFAVPMLVHLAQLGGDHFEWRVLDEIWPVFYVAAAEGIVVSGRWVADRVGRPVAAPALVALAAATVLVYGTAIPLAHDAETLGMTRRQAQALKLELTAETSPALFRVPGLAWVVPVHNRASSQLIGRWIGNRHISHATFGEHEREDFLPYEPFAGTGFLPPDAVTSRLAVGVFPFALPDLTVIDENGLTDHAVARNPVPASGRRRMAHEREPPVGYLVARGANIWIQPAARSEDRALKAAPYALRLADDVWMPFDSPDPAWVARSFGTAVARRASVEREVVLAERRIPEGSAAAAEPGATFHDGTRRLPVAAWLGRFDGDALDGWWHGGAAFERQPHESGAGGRVDTSEAHRRSAAVGLAVSPRFDGGSGRALAFRVGGGDAPGLGVRLVDEDGEILGTWHGRRDPTLRPVVVPLEPYAGRRLHVEIADLARGRSAALIVDDVALVELPAVAAATP